VCGPSKCLQNPAVGHALVQLKSNSGYDVYYSLVVGVRKGRTSPITEEMNQMKTPSRAVCV
jgi:hypothetical protein